MPTITFVEHSGEEHQVDLTDGQALLSVALWQGESGQRDGLKHVSMGWINLGGDS